MIKKFVIAFIAIMTLGVVAVPAAQAKTMGPKTSIETNCKSLDTGSATRQVCVALDIDLFDKINGHSWVNGLSSPVGWAWRTDYVHMIMDGVLVKQAGPTGWMVGTDDSFDTPRWSCQINRGNYKAVWRGRVRSPNGNLSPWTVINSTTSGYICV